MRDPRDPIIPINPNPAPGAPAPAQPFQSQPYGQGQDPFFQKLAQRRMRGQHPQGQHQPGRPTQFPGHPGHTPPGLQGRPFPGAAPGPQPAQPAAQLPPPPLRSPSPMPAAPAMQLAPYSTGQQGGAPPLVGGGLVASTFQRRPGDDELGAPVVR